MMISVSSAVRVTIESVAGDQQPDSIVPKSPQSSSTARCVQVLCQRSLAISVSQTGAANETVEVIGVCDVFTAHEESSPHRQRPLRCRGSNLLTFRHMLSLDINRNVIGPPALLQNTLLKF